MFWAAEEPPEGHQVFYSSLVSFMYTKREIVEGKPWLHQERASEPPLLVTSRLTRMPRRSQRVFHWLGRGRGK